MRIRVWAAAAAMAVCAWAGAVKADIYTVIFTGHIVGGASSAGLNSGIDYLGVFGTAGQSLQGQSYTAVLNFDSSKGEYLSDSIQEQVRGGFNGLSSPLSATLTINGVSFSYGDGPGAFSYALSLYTIGGGNKYVVEDNNNRIDAIWAPGGPDPFADTIFSSYARDSDNAGFTNLIFEFGIRDNERYQLRAGAWVTTPAPEPATWAMMLLGFGGLAAIVRRRRAIPIAAVVAAG